MKLLTHQSPKIAKSDADGKYLSAIMYLWPGGPKVCPSASKGCLASCLVTAGRGRFDKVQAARKARRKFWLTKPFEFLEQLDRELNAHKKKAARLGRKPIVRLNGTGDIAWERHKVMARHPEILFYDYTKRPERMRDYLKALFPVNYKLVFSRSETQDSWFDCSDFCKAGGVTVWVVEKWYKERLLRESAYVDGDLHDRVFEHPPRSIVLLSPKGKAKKDKSGFVVR